MTDVHTHYENLLADLYTWLMGGFEKAATNNMQFFKARGIKPRHGGIALDLGAGSGFQSIPLAKLGFRVTAIDLSHSLLQELELRRDKLDITTVNADILTLTQHISTSCELVVCMTDTLTHLQRREDVVQLVNDVFASLEPEGKFIITFRDLSLALEGTKRFIPMRSDDNTIFTCFLEYQPDTVTVNDVVYRRANDKWQLHTSCYSKLRISERWLTDTLSRAGFILEESGEQSGFCVVIASKPARHDH